MSAASANRPRAGRRWIPVLALAPLIALVAADAVMAMLALRSDPGLVADAPRRIGLAHVAPAAELRLDLSLVPRPEGHLLGLRLRDAAGQAVAAERVEGRLERATHAGEDRPLRFVPGTDGAWTALVAPPDAGAWQVSALARDGAGRSALAVARLPP
jgi:nitrogen fixation protein FixH